MATKEVKPYTLQHSILNFIILAPIWIAGYYIGDYLFDDKFLGLILGGTAMLSFYFAVMDEGIKSRATMHLESYEEVTERLERIETQVEQLNEDHR